MGGRPPHATDFAETQATRRIFLRGALWAGLLAASLGSVAGAIRYLWPARRRSGDTVLVPRARQPLPGDAPRYIEEGGFWLVALQPGEGVPPAWAPEPGSVLPAGGPGVLALTGVCTHQGCEAPWRPDWELDGIRGWFLCPCHHGTFNRAGINIFGPPLRPMDTLRVVRRLDGSLKVYSRHVHRGGPDNPRRTLPI
jgi:Rieske Fe-S protein